MAKKSMIEREKKRINLTNKYTEKRKNLLIEYKNTKGFNSSKIRIRNRCWKTGRPRGYYSDFGLSRHVLREMAHQCLLPGVKKSSW